MCPTTPFSPIYNRGNHHQTNKQKLAILIAWHHDIFIFSLLTLSVKNRAK